MSKDIEDILRKKIAEIEQDAVLSAVKLTSKKKTEQMSSSKTNAIEANVIDPLAHNKSEISLVNIFELDERNTEFPWDKNVANIRILNRLLSNAAFLICVSITLCILNFGTENVFEGITSWLWAAALMMLGWGVVHISEKNRSLEKSIPGPARFR